MAKEIILRMNRGVVQDTPASMLGPEYLSDARHVRFLDGNLRKMGGRSLYYDASSIAGSKPWNSIFSWQYSGLPYLLLAKRDALYMWDGSTATQIASGLEGTDASYQMTFAAFGSHILASDGIVTPKKMVYPYDEWSDIADSPPAADVVKVFQRHAILLGVSGYPNRVVWSDIDDYDVWTPASDNEAGDMDLYESSTPIVGGDGVGDFFAVYTGTQIHVFQYVGGVYVFSRRIASYNTGLWNKRLLCTQGNMQYFMSPLGFYSFNGMTETEIGSGINQYVYGVLDKDNIGAGFCFPNSEWGEIWFCLPITGSDGKPTLACIYNYRDGSWTFDDIAWWHGVGKVPTDYPLISRDDYKIYEIDKTENDSGSALTGYAVSAEFGGEQIESYKHVMRIIPEIYTTCTAVKFSIGYRSKFNDAVTWTDPYTFNPQNDWKIDTATMPNGNRPGPGGHLLRIKVYTDGVDTPLENRSLRHSISVALRPTHSFMALRKSVN